MKPFKQQVEQEADKVSQTYQRVNSYGSTYRSHRSGFEMGAEFAARLIVEMLKNEKIQIDDKTEAFVYGGAINWLQKEIERDE